jgi:hypothetical protein
MALASFHHAIYFFGDNFGDNQVEEGLKKDLIHCLGGLPLHARQDVSVDPQRGRYILVSQDLGDYLDLRVRGEEGQGCVGVPQVVELDRRDPGPLS